MTRFMPSYDRTASFVQSYDIKKSSEYFMYLPEERSVFKFDYLSLKNAAMEPVFFPSLLYE